MSAAVWMIPLAIAGCVFGQEVEVRLQIQDEGIEFGRAFSLTVIRTWPAADQPDAWDDAVLAPLTLEARDTVTAREGDSVSETRRFLARAFVRDRVVLPAWRFQSLGHGGRVRGTEVPETSMVVRTALAGHGPDVELPSGLFPVPSRMPFLAWVAMFFGAAFLGTLWLRGTRRRKMPTEALVTGSSWDEARTRLIELEDQELHASDAESGLGRLGPIVRDYFSSKFSLRCQPMSSEELTATVAARQHLKPDELEILEGALGASDLARFTGRVPVPSRRVELFREVRGLLERSDATETGGGPSG